MSISRDWRSALSARHATWISSVVPGEEIVAQATDREQLRFVDAEELRGWITTLEGVPIMGVKDEVLGGLDGLLVRDQEPDFGFRHQAFRRLRGVAPSSASRPPRRCTACPL